jgi:hypothetical protein
VSAIPTCVTVNLTERVFVKIPILCFRHKPSFLLKTDVNYILYITTHLRLNLSNWTFVKIYKICCLFRLFSCSLQQRHLSTEWNFVFLIRLQHRCQHFPTPLYMLHDRPIYTHIPSILESYPH